MPLVLDVPPAPGGSGPVGDAVKQPDHYKWIPGIECKEVTRHFSFLLGSAIKYIWRAGRKGSRLTDLRKARECLDAEIYYLEKEQEHGKTDDSV
jgi:hypothetical protein